MAEQQQLSHIKKAGEADHISKDEFEKRIVEIAKCKRDIKYFAEKYFKIINLDSGLCTIKLYDKQKDLLDFFTNEKRCIVLASRQSSKTTTYTIYALWLLMFHCEKRIMLLANKADTVTEIISRIQLAYEYLPNFLKVGVVTWNKQEIIFSNKSAIKGFATASDAARGYSANCVIADEFSFVPNNIASRVFESIYPVISSSKTSQFIIVSTPNGADPNNLYYDIWQKANQKNVQKNTDGWKPFRFDWWDVPGRDEQWKNNTIASIGERRFAQEFGNEFLSGASSKKLVPDDIIERYRMKLSEYKIQNIRPKQCKILAETEDKMFKFDVWHVFQKNRTYCAVADISEGVGGDDSVLYIWDVTDLRNITMCVKFASNTVSLVEFAYICSKILPIYGDPPLFAERNGVSAGMLDSLRITYKYDNIPIENKKNEPGIYSHITVKTRSCLWAREMLTTDGFGFTVYDKDLIDEMGTFVKKDNKGVQTVFQAAAGAYDDKMMCLVWLCYALNQERIDQYFVVCQNFTSAFGQIYPRMLMPVKPYDPAVLDRISNDPVYNDLTEFQNEGRHKYQQMHESIRIEDKNDIFKYETTDPYFGGYNDEPSWNSENSARNPNNHMPVFFI